MCKCYLKILFINFDAKQINNHVIKRKKKTLVQLEQELKALNHHKLYFHPYQTLN